MGAVMSTLRRGALGAAPVLDQGLVGMAIDAGAKYGVNPALILGIIHQESGGNPGAINPNDPSYGLMQVMVPTARAYDPTITATGLLDPLTNVDLGTHYFADQLARYGGDVNQALSAYNAGTATPRNQSYVSAVLARVDAFAAALGVGSTDATASDGSASDSPGTLADWIGANPWLVGAGALAIVLLLWRR